MNPFVEDHLTVGLGYSGLKNFELNAALVIGLKNTVHVGASHPFAPDMQQSTTGMQYVSTLMQISYKW
jgi:hypothetical protein